jgi:tRNA(Ile)-lysidine synthase TilS/MesJ
MLRNSAYGGLVGMLPRTTRRGLVILRPLLCTRRQTLRDFLSHNQIRWREDASNQSPKYFRNRLRKLLAAAPSLSDELLALSAACTQLRQWARSAAPELNETINVEKLAKLPKILAAESARKWLMARGMPAREVQKSVIERLLAMADDAATSPRQDFPGKLRIRRRGGIIFGDGGA